MPEWRLLEENGHPNMSVMKPDMTTLFKLPWVKDEDGNVAMSEVICDPYWKCEDREFGPINFSPRTVAQTQLNRLKAKGMYLLSSFEFEFRLQKRTCDDNYQWAYDIDYYSSVFILKIESYLIKLESALRALHIFIEAIHTELGSGMIEITLEPLQGILAADAAFRFKKTANEIAHMFDMRACFMAKPVLRETGNGLHYNHSLWKIADDINIFYDDGVFSQKGINWVSGIVTYGNDSIACYCPTMNCYRRVHHPWGPYKLDWGVEARTTSIRVKVGSQSGTYVENRIPSSSANPYMVLAANLASGLLGLDKQIVVNKNDDDAKPLSKTLGEALVMFQTDSEFVKMFGEELVTIFVQSKLKCEVKCMTEKFKSCKTEEEELEIEKQFYMVLL